MAITLSGTSGALQPRRTALIVSAAALLAAMLLPFVVGLGVDLPTLGTPIMIGGIFYALSRLTRRWPNPAMHIISECLALLTLCSAVTIILSYCAMRLALPLADAQLVGLDAMLGFDAGAIVRWFDAKGTYSFALELAYCSFWPQLILMPMLLTVYVSPASAYRFVTAFVLICLTSCAISAGYPCLSAYSWFGLQPGDFQTINPALGVHFLDSFNGVRGDPNFVVSASEISGIITFPSVHAAVAALCTLAAWPLRRGRWLFLILNLAMTLSAITHGSHYVIDLFAGIAIALVAVALTFRNSDKTLHPAVTASVPVAA